MALHWCWCRGVGAGREVRDAWVEVLQVRRREEAGRGRLERDWTTVRRTEEPGGGAVGYVL